MWAAASAAGIKRIIHLTNRDFFLDPVSSTFHGRDIFAPVAAHISAGLKDISVLGPCVDECVKHAVPDIKPLGHARWELIVVAIDRFGNITLNMTGDEFKNIVHDRKFCLTMNNTCVEKYFDVYADADEGQCFLMCSSFSFMEIALKNSSAAARLDAKPMDRAVLEVFSLS
jgi:S-adenosylmethionine hydrolase